MATSAQSVANLANAQLSTGPRTAEGKARSAQNARKHGLDSREFVVRPDEQEDFDAFIAAYAAEVSPQGAMELALFQDLVHARWNMKRVRRLEAELAATGPDPLLDPERGPIADRLARHHTRFDRLHQRALKELRLLQTNRSLRHENARDIPAEFPVLVPIAVFAKQSRSLVNVNPWPAHKAGILRAVDARMSAIPKDRLLGHDLRMPAAAHGTSR
jgi:hypothetical protein